MNPEEPSSRKHAPAPSPPGTAAPGIGYGPPPVGYGSPGDAGGRLGPPPGGFGAGGTTGVYGPMNSAPSRRPYVLAGLGAFMAAGYWGFLTLMTGFSAVAAGTSGTMAILPVVLVVLYVVRGLRVMKGELRSARSLFWLHGVGMVCAVFGIFGGESLIVAGLHAIKIAIHVFGLIVTYRAKKQAEAFPLPFDQIPMT